MSENNPNMRKLKQAQRLLRYDADRDAQKRREDAQLTASMALDMFTSKWGFGEPPEAYRDAWQRDLDTVQWLDRLTGQR